MEERLEPQLAVALDRVASLTSAISTASEQARQRALRLDATAARLADDLRGLVDLSAERVEGMAEDTAETLAARVAAPSESARRRFVRAMAVVQGLRRGLAVWRGDDGP
jgi:hypothetical protein